MPVKRWLVPVIAIGALLGSVLVGQVTGLWQTTGTRLTSLSGASPEDIKGSSTLGEISDTFTIPLPELRALLGLPADTPADTQMKDLEEYNEVSVVREKVAAYTGIPLEGSSSEPTEAASAPVTPMPDASVTATHAGSTPLPEGQILPASEIKGSMTLQQVSDQCGIPLDTLYKELKLSADIAPSTSLKDLGAQISGFEVSVVRDIVGAYQAR